MNGNNVMKNKSIVFIAALVVLITLISAANVFSASYIYYGSTDTQAIKTIGATIQAALTGYSAIRLNKQ